MGTKRKNLVGQTFGTLEVIEYVGDGRWKVKCTKCGVVKDVRGWDITSGRVKSCGVCGKFIDITGQVFGEWTVISYAGNRKWNCRCSCGNERVVESKRLRDGISASCGHATNAFKDITGQQFGDWKVISYAGNKKWNCECKCGNKGVIEGSKLRNGEAIRCQSCAGRAHAIDLTGKRFGDWLVIEYCKDRPEYWRCQCQCGCGTVRDVHGYSLRTGRSTGCGNRGKTAEQLEVFNNMRLLTRFIIELNAKLGRKPTIYDIADGLHTTYSPIYKRVQHSEKLRELINIGDMYHSKTEYELMDLIQKHGHEVILGDRRILEGKELDIYIPNKHTALEFNGDYWHSDLFKDDKYHQNKLIECAKHGIMVVNIFEYEWVNPILRNRIISHIENIVNNKINIKADDVVASYIDKNIANQFLNTYSIDGDLEAMCYIGLTCNNEIMAIAAFNEATTISFEFEVSRIAIKHGIELNGLEKIMSKFIQDYAPNSVVAYCDLSKSIGLEYPKMGFSRPEDAITEPNSVWTKPGSGNIIDNLIANVPRYTEDELHDMGYCRVFDCGKLRFEWRRNN